MMRPAILAMAVVVVVVDGDTSVIPRDLVCLTTKVGEPVTLYLEGDGIFADGFETGDASRWPSPQPPGPPPECGP